jgi:RHS repeat-associated protein
VLAHDLSGSGPDAVLAHIMVTSGGAGSGGGSGAGSGGGSGGSSERVLWYLPDHLGSVRGIVDSGGRLVDTLRYDASGVLTAESNPSGGEGAAGGGGVYPGLLPRYAGYEWDSALGLYHVGARWYDPSQGRWLSRDPLGLAADSNPYRYVENNALNYSDPSGEIAPAVFMIIAGGAAGWWLLGPGAGTANAPAPGQEGFRPPPRPFLEDAAAGLPGMVFGGFAGGLAGGLVPGGVAGGAGIGGTGVSAGGAAIGNAERSALTWLFAEAARWSAQQGRAAVRNAPLPAAVRDSSAFGNLIRWGRGTDGARRLLETLRMYALRQPGPYALISRDCGSEELPLGLPLVGRKRIE